MIHTFGIEIETSGASIPEIKRAFANAEIRGCDVKGPTARHELTLK